MKKTGNTLMIVLVCAASIALHYGLFTLACVPVITVIDEIGSDMHGDLAWVNGPDGEDSLLSYHGNTYYSAGGWLDATLKSSDVEIGWQYGFPFPNFYYYTDGSDQPLYILGGSGTYAYTVYLQSGYDFKKQTYTVPGTDFEFVLEEALTLVEDPDSLNTGDICGTMEFPLKDEPRLRIELFYKRDSHGGWYLSTPDGLCRISDEVIAAMQEAD